MQGSSASRLACVVEARFRSFFLPDSHARKTAAADGTELAAFAADIYAAGHGAARGNAVPRLLEEEEEELPSEKKQGERASEECSEKNPTSGLFIFFLLLLRTALRRRPKLFSAFHVRPFCARRAPLSRFSSLLGRRLGAAHPLAPSGGIEKKRGLRGEGENCKVAVKRSSVGRSTVSRRSFFCAASGNKTTPPRPFSARFWDAISSLNAPRAWKVNQPLRFC